MKIAIDDKCSEVFKQLKFEKKHRYVVFKIEKEQVVYSWWYRLLKVLVRENTIGVIYSIHFNLSSTDSLSLILTSRLMTELTPVRSSSLTGSLIHQKSRWKCYTQLPNKISRHILILTLSNSMQAALMM